MTSVMVICPLKLDNYLCEQFAQDLKFLRGSKNLEEIVV
jgi:hypothetical protein